MNFLNTVSAAGSSVDIGDLAKEITPFQTFGSFVEVIIRNAFVLAGVITLILLIFGGFGVIVAAGSGDSKKMEQGKKTITSAVLGLIIVVGSFWIIQILEKITGVAILSPKL